MNNSLKFVWAYMIENGKLTDGRWSYYGSDWESIHEYDWQKAQGAYERFKFTVKTIGVDWEKTSPPTSDMNSGFTDTFHASETIETLIGDITLKNGSTYKVGVKHAEERFSSYAKTLTKLIDDNQRVKDILGE